MREILSKAKRKNWRELPKERWWVEGYVIKDDITGQVFIHAQGNSVNESQKIGEEGYLRFVAFEVDPETLCQYTGQTDKNRQRIWENDTVTVIDDNGNSGTVDTGVWEVEFLEGNWYVSGNVQSSLYDINNVFQIEVKGNIFDNPEMLKEDRHAYCG